MNAMSNVTNEERREVATRLRCNAQLCPNALFDLHETVGDSTYTLGGIATRLADLIDRPTCHDVTDLDRESFKCSRCGYRVLSIDGAPDAAKLVSPKGGVVDFGYCPNCGAEVVSND